MHRAIDALVSGLLFLGVMYFIMSQFIIIEVNTARVVRDSTLTDIAESAADYIALYIGHDYYAWMNITMIKYAVGNFTVIHGLAGSGIDLLIRVRYYRLRNEYVGLTIIVVDERGIIYTDNIDSVIGLPHSVASRSIVANSIDGKTMLVNLLVVAYRSG